MEDYPAVRIYPAQMLARLGLPSNQQPTPTVPSAPPQVSSQTGGRVHLYEPSRRSPVTTSVSCSRTSAGDPRSPGMQTSPAAGCREGAAGPESAEQRTLTVRLSGDLRSPWRLGSAGLNHPCPGLLPWLQNGLSDLTRKTPTQSAFWTRASCPRRPRRSFKLRAGRRPARIAKKYGKRERLVRIASGQYSCTLRGKSRTLVSTTSNSAPRNLRHHN